MDDDRAEADDKCAKIIDSLRDGIDRCAKTIYGCRGTDYGLRDGIDECIESIYSLRHDICR